MFGININEDDKIYKKNILTLNPEIQIHKKKDIKLLDYISLIKIISAYLVILKHTNRNYWIFSEYWISINIICSFCMCAVPLFNLCIGATLLDFNMRYEIYEYLKRRINKIVIPIIGWNVIYFFYRYYFIKDIRKQKFTIYYFISLYFNNDLAPLVSSLRIFLFGYMIIPFIAYVELHNKIKIYLYGFLILLLNTSIIPYFINFFNKIGDRWPYNYNFGYIIYLFAGYIIQNYKFNIKIKTLIYIFGLSGLLSRMIISHYLTMKYKKPDRTQINYINLPIVTYSCSVFLFIKENYKYMPKIIKKEYINKIGSLSMGPFYLHYVFIWGFFKLFKYNEFSFIYRFYGSFIITLLCFIITFLMKKIPIIKILVP